MSRAKKTKRQKKYSQDHLYRHITDLLNGAKKRSKEASEK